MAELDRADIERRLRIRRRNLERLEAEAKEIVEGEAPPAVLARLQAQIRVEREEIRFLEEQIAELDARSPRRAVPANAFLNLPTRPSILLRVAMAIVATAIILIIAVLVLPRGPHALIQRVPPTHTPQPTYTLVAGEALTTGSLTLTVSLTPTDTPTPTPAQAPTPTPTPKVITGVVEADPFLNVRGGPGTNFPIRGKLNKGEEVLIHGRNEAGDWLAISTTVETGGWVAAQYISMTVQVSSLPIKEASQ